MIAILICVRGFAVLGKWKKKNHCGFDFHFPVVVLGIFSMPVGHLHHPCFYFYFLINEFIYLQYCIEFAIH